jgi:uncharacterized protein
MSAVNPSYDLDAIQRAQRAYEPSMEEILASIRSIISEDRATPAKEPVAAAALEEETIASVEAPAVERDVAPVESITGPRVVWPKPEPAIEPEAPSAPRVEASEPAPTIGDEPLISAATNAAIASSFDALSISVAVQNSGIIEGAVRDMIRPMLKAWLDDNLPSIVESLVRAEIQRVARGGR